MAQYSIKEIETLSGVKAHTLRIWEQRYDFLKPKRTDTNIRYYTDEQMRLLLNIGTLNRNGVKISKIAEMDAAELNRQAWDIYQGSKEPDDMLDALVLSMIDFNEPRFERTLLQAINRLGFEKAFTELAFPFMNRTGALWATGAVNVAQEHFVTNLLRRKIFVAIDGLVAEPGPKAKKCILFLPEGEIHDLLLLFTEYLLRKAGHNVIYLGASLPVCDLRDVITARKPDFLITYFTIPVADMPFDTYIKLVLKNQQKATLIVGGSLIEQSKVKLPANCIRVGSATELLSVVAA